LALSVQGVMITTHLHFSAEVKNEWSYTSIPPVYFHGEYDDKMIFTFTVWRLSRSLINMLTTADSPFSLSQSHFSLGFSWYFTVSLSNFIFPSHILLPPLKFYCFLSNLISPLKFSPSQISFSPLKFYCPSQNSFSCLRFYCPLSNFIFFSQTLLPLLKFHFLLSNFIASLKFHFPLSNFIAPLKFHFSPLRFYCPLSNFKTRASNSGGTDLSLLLCHII
jgi:hypothetical protein